MNVEIEHISDEDLNEVSGGAVLFQGKTSSASTLGQLEEACRELGGKFSVSGSGNYSFSCTR